MLTPLPKPFRHATPADALAMVELVNIAGDGLPAYLWAKFARPGQSAWDVARERASGGLGGFAFHNTIVRDVDGEVAACMIGYPQDAAPSPPPMPDDCIAARGELAALAPLADLTRRIPDVWYLNVLATAPRHRGKGYASELLTFADQRARDAGKPRIGLIVSNANRTALRLYDRHGFVRLDSRPIVHEGWRHDGDAWLLLVKPVSA